MVRQVDDQRAVQVTIFWLVLGMEEWKYPVVIEVSRTNMRSRIFFVLWLAGLMVCGSSCSPSAPKERTPFEVQKEKDRQSKWRMATMLGEYERVGRKDPKWDEDAKSALESLASMNLSDATERSKDFKRVAHFADSAVRAGCDDPLVNYLYVYLDFDAKGRTTNEAVNVFLKVAADMSASGYSEIRKFYACLRSAQWIHNLDRSNGEIWRLREEARNNLRLALADKALPPEEARDACLAMLKAMQYYPGDEFWQTYQALEGPLLKNFSQTPAPYAVKGAFYVDYAWKARGGGYADNVSEEGWKLFGERLDVAGVALEKGWRLDPADPFAPTHMLSVMLGQGKSREEVEVWFERAMKANSNNWEACNSKLTYLHAKWYGSVEDMLAFGRECLTNASWGGGVTLMVVDAHDAIATYSGEGKKYWKRPEVWPEIHAAYEEYFRRNPEAVGYRHNYAWYAYVCEDWDVLNQQLPLLGEINYSYFGGKEAFDDMVRNAKEHARK